MKEYGDTIAAIFSSFKSFLMRFSSNKREKFEAKSDPCTCQSKKRLMIIKYLQFCASFIDIFMFSCLYKVESLLRGAEKICGPICGQKSLGSAAKK